MDSRIRIFRMHLHLNWTIEFDIMSFILTTCWISTFFTLSISQGVFSFFPLDLTPAPKTYPPVEIKLRSVLNFSDPQITLFDYDDIDDGIQGHLVYADPIHACSPIQLPPEDYFVGSDSDYDLERKSKFWILLANSLDCDLNTKISHALSAKYSAILVGDVMEPSITSESNFFTGDGGIVHVSSIIKGTGAEANFESNNDYLDNYQDVYGDHAQANEYVGRVRYAQVLMSDLVSHSLVTFIGFAAGIIVVLMLIWLFQILGGNRRLDLWLAQKSSQMVKAALESTTVQLWKPDAPFLNNESCIICLEDFTPEHEVRILKCSHGFHSSCVDPWILKVTPSCPTCKQAVGDNLTLPNATGDEESLSPTSAPEIDHWAMLPVPVLTTQQTVYAGF